MSLFDAMPLGEFCQLLKAVVVHAVMVRYLDNEKNVAGRINENHARSDEDIAETLKTLLTSAEIAQGTGRKFKDSIRYVISVVRLAYDENPIINTTPVINWLNRMGEPLYGRGTPVVIYSKTQPSRQSQLRLRN